jgi:hypothetical protein
VTGYEAIQSATDTDGLALITDSPWWEPDEWRT